MLMKFKNGDSIEVNHISYVYNLNTGSNSGIGTEVYTMTTNASENASAQLENLKYLLTEDNISEVTVSPHNTTNSYKFTFKKCLSVKLRVDDNGSSIQIDML